MGRIELGFARVAVPLLGALALSELPTDVTAQERVGEAKRIVNTVTGKGAVGARPIVREDPVYRNEQVSAKPDSRGELQLVDGSKIIVGEGSSIKLDRFVVSDQTIKRGTINVTKGAFRFISGSSKKAIRVRTPLSTIGIRGTTFDVYVDGGVTRVVLLSGEIEACANGGACITLSRVCDVAEISGANSIQQLPFLFSNERTPQQEAALFNLTVNQQRHSEGWRAQLIPCFARAASQSNSSNSPAGEGDPPDPGPAPDPTPPSEPSPPGYGGYG